MVIMTSSESSSDFDRKMPATIGPYFIESRLGSGGMGTVYLGRHKETGEFAAVKLLPASMAREEGFVARFDREIAAMQQLKNPHIVQFLESGAADETYYYAMEYVDGGTLADRLEKEGRLPWREVIQLGVQICTALKSAHNAGVIHRDLKPSNLLLTRDGQIKLTDFGVAQVFAGGRLTVTGGILGTAEYMSPEQARGKRATKQSDIYSLGAVMYVMLTGRPPFQGKSVLDIIQKHQFAQFDSVKRLVPEVPFWLDEVVCKCLSKNLEDRYPDAYVLSLRLQEVARKVDFQSQHAEGAADLDETQDTLADAVSGRPTMDEVGGTLVRDLFRAQLEDEKAASRIQKFFDNVWVLVGLLVLLVGSVYGLMLVNTPSPQQRFDQGVELMSRPEGLAWETAKREYFEPLLQQDAHRWEKDVLPYLEQIEVYELRKKLLGRSQQQIAIPESEPEAVIRQAMDLRRQGRLAESRLKLIALRELLEGDGEYDTFNRLLDQLIADIAHDESADRLVYVASALDRADQHFRDGQVEKAISIWFSVKKLYDSDPDAEALVRRAEERYLEATGVQLLGSEDDLLQRPNSNIGK